VKGGLRATTILPPDCAVNTYFLTFEYYCGLLVNQHDHPHAKSRRHVNLKYLAEMKAQKISLCFLKMRVVWSMVMSGLLFATTKK
jgi:hypothetical protein